MRVHRTCWYFHIDFIKNMTLSVFCNKFILKFISKAKQSISLCLVLRDDLKLEYPLPSPQRTESSSGMPCLTLTIFNSVLT